MILYCQRQNALVDVRLQPDDYWSFTACYEQFEILMREKNPKWEAGVGERFIVDFRAKDITEKHIAKVGLMKRAAVDHRNGNTF